jgi:hypothetical protein
VPTKTKRAAAKRNIKKATKAARRKKTIARLPRKTRTALAKEGAKLHENLPDRLRCSDHHPRRHRPALDRLVLWASTFGHLFFQNLIYFAFSRDLLRLFSGHPDLIYLLSPMRGVLLLCCLRRAFYNLSRCHGLSASA